MRKLYQLSNRLRTFHALFGYLLLLAAVAPASVSDNIGDRSLVSALVTSMHWMTIRQQRPEHFVQHWPQPVPPKIRAAPKFIATHLFALLVTIKRIATGADPCFCWSTGTIQRVHKRFAVKQINASVTLIDNRSSGLFNREARARSQVLDKIQRYQNGKQRTRTLLAQGNAGVSP